MKIVGNTVGMGLPKPDLRQTNPKKGDYVKGKDKIPSKVSQLENDKGYLTEHQDISGKLDASELPTAINTALAQAKASGEFDGADGQDGKDGTSVTHRWNGTVLEVTSASGTFSADLKGQSGEDGQDGYTPKKGVDYFDGQDGKDGKDGTNGTNGKDGVSPTVAVSKSGKVTTISITDKNGTKTATINDGSDGVAGKDGTDGSPGKDGTNGKDGTSVTVTNVTESTADGGGNVVTFSDGKTLTVKNGSKGSTGDKGDKGDTGQRGTGLLAVTTAPSSYTTAVGGITPKYRMSISTIKTQSGATEVLLGDTVRYSYYHYPIAYLDASYAYFTTRVSIRGASGSAGSAGAAGADGKSAYAYAQDGGYTGTEEEFSQKLAQEPLIGSTAEITPAQVAEALEAGRDISLTHTDSNTGTITFNQFVFVAAYDMVLASAVVHMLGKVVTIALYGFKSGSSWTMSSTQLAQNSDVPAPVIGSTEEITPAQVADAVSNGRNVILTHMDGTYGAITFNNFIYIPALGVVISSAIVYFAGDYLVMELIGSTRDGSWAALSKKVATVDDIPESLKNPYALTINGTSYDGSETVDLTEAVNNMIVEKLNALTHAEEVAF